MAREPEPFNAGADTSESWLWAMVAGVLGILMIVAITSSEDTDRQVREFTEGCSARWADYENKVLSVDHGSSETHTCVVKVNGKWTPEVNVKVTP